MVEQTHRQKEPLLLTVDKGPSVSEDKVDASKEDESREPVDSPLSSVVYELTSSLQDTASGERREPVAELDRTDSSVEVDHSGLVEQSEEASGTEEPPTNAQDTAITDDQTGPTLNEGIESDEEEKTTILTEENVLLLEESEMVYKFF